jgi:hypothetical protein
MLKRELTHIAAHSKLPLGVLVMLVAGFLCFALAGVVTAQTSPGSEPSGSSASGRRFNIYSHLGSVALPEGYEGVLTRNFTDAWSGHIETKEGEFTIYWSAGLVESVFEKYESTLMWTMSRDRGGLRFTFGQSLDDGKSTLMAKIRILPFTRDGESFPGGDYIQFSAVASDERQRRAFDSIVVSYQRERCTTCRNFRHRVVQ